MYLPTYRVCLHFNHGETKNIYIIIVNSDDKMAIGESRTELLHWLNSTLDLLYGKVENCGTGAAYCQLMDSIVGGIPMTKVKFNAQTEYDYIHNFKILQASFTKHKVNKTIDVERLVKCRLQDNLLLLQWFKKFWHENKDVNGVYDAASKRKVSGLYSNGSGFSVTPQNGRGRRQSRRLGRVVRRCLAECHRRAVRPSRQTPPPTPQTNLRN